MAPTACIADAAWAGGASKLVRRAGPLTVKHRVRRRYWRVAETVSAGRCGGRTMRMPPEQLGGDGLHGKDHGDVDADAGPPAVAVLPSPKYKAKIFTADDSSRSTPSAKTSVSGMLLSSIGTLSSPIGFINIASSPCSV